MPFQDANVGGIILQAAQGIANLAVQQQRLQVQRTEQLREQQAAQRAFSFKQQELESKERALTIQEEQLLRQQRLDALRQQEQQLDVRIKELKIDALEAGPTEEPLSPNERIRREDVIFEEANRRMFGILAQNYNSRNGADVPSLPSREAYFSEVQKARRAADTNRALIGQLTVDREFADSEEGVARIDALTRDAERLVAQAQDIEKFTGSVEFERAFASPEMRKAVEVEIFGRDQGPIADLSQRLLENRLTKIQLEDQRKAAFGQTVDPVTVDNALDLARRGNMTELHRLSLSQFEGLTPGSEPHKRKWIAISDWIRSQITDPDETSKITRDLFNQTFGSQP